MSSNQQESKFWGRLLLTGALAGALGGAIVTLTMSLWASVTFLPSSSIILTMTILGAVYGVGQGAAQFLSLRQQIPRIRQSLRTNFISTAVGSTVTGVLLVALLAIGFAELLNSLGYSSALIVVLSAFIVGGFGGIAQAIVERSLLKSAAQGSYWRWIAPLALLGHVSGALAGLAIAPFW